MAAEMDGQAIVTEARSGSIGTRRKKAPPEPRAPQVFLTVLRRHDSAVLVRILLGRVTFAVAPTASEVSADDRSRMYARVGDSSNPAMISRQCLRIFEREHGGTTCIVVW